MMPSQQEALSKTWHPLSYLCVSSGFPESPKLLQDKVNDELVVEFAVLVEPQRSPFWTCRM